MSDTPKDRETVERIIALEPMLPSLPPQETDVAKTLRALLDERDAAVARAEAAEAERDKTIAALSKEGHKRGKLETELNNLRKITIDCAAHLTAAISLLEKGGKKAAPSDKMFKQMLADYNASLERTRVALRNGVAVGEAAGGSARLCLSCGRSAPASHDRGQPGPDCPAPDACTFDLTLDEAWQHWREKAHKERTRAEAAEAERDEAEAKLAEARATLEQIEAVDKGHAGRMAMAALASIDAKRAALRNGEPKD